MKSKERIAAAVALERADRVPVAPLLDHFAATYAGITKHALMTDPDQRIAAILKTMAELGPWDMTFMAETVIPELLVASPARLKMPGRDLPPDEIHQFEEFELLTPDDYDLMNKLGFSRFLQNVARRLDPKLSFFRTALTAVKFALMIRKHARLIRRAGADPAVGFLCPGPLYEYFSLGRSMSQMALDIFDRPEKIKLVSREWAVEMTKLAIRFATVVGIPRIFIGLSRTSPAMLNPRHFEEFALPELDYMVNAFIDSGFTPLFHMDTDWTRNLHYFRRFPPKKCIVELDGATDIFKAKEILGDHSCIMGDVPAYMLAFSTKDEVMAYCKRLLTSIGPAGFILSSGCSIPANAKPENVRALAEAVEDFGGQS